MHQCCSVLLSSVVADLAVKVLISGLFSTSHNNSGQMINMHMLLVSAQGSSDVLWLGW